MDTALFEQVRKTIRRKSEATQVIIGLEEYLANFFLPNSNKEIASYFAALRPEIAKQLQEDLGKLSNLSQSEIKKNVLALEDTLRQTRIVQLTLAFQPDDEAVALFAEAIRSESDPNTLIDVQYDKTIVGGVLIVSDGRYKDYSIRKKLADRFQIQKDDIMKLMN